MADQTTCTGPKCKKKWGEGCPHALEQGYSDTYHLCYSAAGSPCSCCCGSLPPAPSPSALDVELTALRAREEENKRLNDEAEALGLDRMRLREALRVAGERERALTKARTEARECALRWEGAVLAHYPTGWAYDPTSPALMVENVVRSFQDELHEARTQIATLRRTQEADTRDHDLEVAWTLLANVSDGNWGMQSIPWQTSVAAWRDRVMPGLSERAAARRPTPESEASATEGT